MSPHPTTATPWDRAAVALLGTAGFALSYDALRQMAVAVHVRGALSFLFPLLIDGFIAYGVRALLVLRTAPPAARVYVWALFGSATGASIWANALHAVRINQQTDPGDDPGLRLGDTTVGALSALAPLALAGAVHLGIIITRHTTRTSRRSDGHNGIDPDGASRLPVALALPATRSTEPRPNLAEDDTRSAESTPRAARTVVARRQRTGRPPGASMDRLLEVARPAVAKHGLTIAVVQKAVRDAGLPLGSARLTQLMSLLRGTDPQHEAAHGHASLD